MENSLLLRQSLSDDTERGAFPFGQTQKIMAGSSEYKTFLSCFDKLVTALKQDPQAVSNELVAESLIPPADGSIDAQKVAQLLLEKIKLSPKRYYDVVKVFSRHEWLGDIVDILQEEHSM